MGGFRLGLEKAAHKCVGFCEIDAKARESYKAIHNTEGEVEMNDITTVSYGLFDQLEVSMLPVEDFRVRLSRLQENGKASKILGELSSLKLQDSHLFSEHAIYSLKMLKDCSTMKEGLRSRQSYEPWMNWGDDVEWQLFNSKNYVAQSRERVFIVGHSRRQCTKKIFPITGKEKSITVYN